MMRSWHNIRLARHGYRSPLTLMTIGGIGVAVAALVMTIAILDGFGSAYRDGLVNFHSPIVVLREDEQVDQAFLAATIAPFMIRTNTDEERGARSEERKAQGRADDGRRTTEYGRLQLANRLIALWEWGSWQAESLALRLRALPWVGEQLLSFSPVHFVDRHATPQWFAWLHDALFEGVADSAMRGVTAVGPFLYREALIAGPKGIRGVAVRGIDPAQLTTMYRLQITMAADAHDPAAELVQRQGPVRMLVGSALAKELGNEDLRLYLPGKSHEGGVPIDIVGTFRSGVHEFDAEFAFVDLVRLQSLYGVPGVITGMELQLDAIDKAPWIGEALDLALGPDYDVRDWRSLNRETFEAMVIEKILFGFLMGILVLIATTNVTTAVILQILERHKTVATLTAIGLSARAAHRIFFWRGMVMGGSGVVLGLVVGTVAAWILGRMQWITIDPEIYFLSSVPTQLHLSTLVIVLLFGLGITAFAASRAAHRVTRLPILQALGRGYL